MENKIVHYAQYHRMKKVGVFADRIGFGQHSYSIQYNQIGQNSIQ